MKKLLPILFLFVLCLAPSLAFAVGETCPKVGVAATSSCCKAPAIIEQVGGCPGGYKWIGDAASGQCQLLITCPGTASSLSCSTGGCYTYTPPPPPGPGPVCSYATVNTDASMNCCTINQIAIRDTTAPSGWKCIDETWTRSGTDIFRAGTGKVGIDTITPAYELDVNGKANATQYCIAGSCISSWAALSPWVVNGTNIYNNNTGSVGIGTATPNSSYKLDVNGIANATQYCIAGSCISSWAALSPWVVSGTNIYNNNTGSVGINTATPAYELVVVDGSDGDSYGSVDADQYCLGGGGCVTSWPAADTGRYVGISQTALNGNRGGYTAANDECRLSPIIALAGSHICTAMEVIATYNNDPAALASLIGSVWVNNGPPGYISNVANDCEGWKSNGSTIFGYVWDGVKDSSYVTPCNLTRKFACCK